ncbi:RcpC/CpaB family pilus assembly protein [Gorillibacterium sp. CAU 1737]|uniref:RcpC/CpaB family pilus assembly protein n=1 Tax=Gorillibacterium sp. CAU 1737 TaxID=3140362 RepID=UPI003260FB16
MGKWIRAGVGFFLMAASVIGYLLFMVQLDRSRSTVETWMPIRTLTSGEVVHAALLRRVSIPVEAHRQDALTDLSQLEGKQVLVPIGREEELAAWKLANVKLAPDVGERYYSFKTDAVTNVNNMVRRGDRVDVWLEWKRPAADGNEEQVLALKVIEALPVAGVKSAEGVEVGDKQGLDVLLTDNAAQLAASRGRAPVKPELNTFIMSDEVYEAYAAAAAHGTLRLALPNLTVNEQEPARVTDQFQAWLNEMAHTWGHSDPIMNGGKP